VSANRFQSERRIGRTPARDTLSQHHWLGWDDALNARAFHPDYDTWPPRFQLTYEWARQRCAAAWRALGRRPRRWPRSESLGTHNERIECWAAVKADCPESFFVDVRAREAA